MNNPSCRTMTLGSTQPLKEINKGLFSGGRGGPAGIEKNKMGGACGAYGAGERGAQGSGGET